MRTLGVCLVVAASLGSATGGETPAARLAAIESAQTAARERYSREFTAAGTTEPAQQRAIDRYVEEVDRNTASALELVRAHPDNPAAFAALKFVIRTNRAGPGDASAKALRMILDRNDVRASGQSDYVGAVSLTLWQYPDAETVLRRVFAENPNRDDRAEGCYWLARHLQQRARLVRRMREQPDFMKDFYKYKDAKPIEDLVRESNPDALDREAETLLERTIAEFGDLRPPGEKRTLAEIATGELFAARNLKIGQTAPDIAGADHQGETFELSDHRGKVVVLTFSGGWCGPCVVMYPDLRALVEKHADRPFALVSVDTDADVKNLRDAIATGTITWRCWWDGGTDGPITTRWGVSAFPTIFVLDEQGVIRFKNVRGDDLARAVASLLDKKREP